MKAKPKNTKKSSTKPTPKPSNKSKKTPALSRTNSKTIFGPDAAYGDKKKRRSEQPRTTKYKIAGENSTQLRYRKVKYN
jgi:hypothetical protein